MISTVSYIFVLMIKNMKPRGKCFDLIYLPGFQFKFLWLLNGQHVCGPVVHMKESESHSTVSDSLQPHGL